MKILISILLLMSTWGIIFPQADLFQKTEASLKNILGDSVNIETLIYICNEEEKTNINKISRKTVKIDSLNIYLAKHDNHVLGCAIVDEVKGRNQYFTFLVVSDIEGNIIDVDILIYRSSHGHEVQNENFRKQFRGKNISDKIQIGKDIHSISGATISSRSLTNGVNKIVNIFEIIKNRLHQLIKNK
ncbi:MAG: FMN-binding protein [Bacteroidota bacterium]|nr:FMN-binding protein [Bacteroidota bacterium]